MDRNTIQVAIYVIGAFVGGASLALFYSNGQEAFLVRDLEQACIQTVNILKHEAMAHEMEHMRGEIGEVDAASRRRDAKATGLSVSIIDEPEQHEQHEEP